MISVLSLDMIKIQVKTVVPVRVDIVWLDLRIIYDSVVKVTDREPHPSRDYL
jgi:hypothetical protein